MTFTQPSPERAPRRPVSEPTQVAGLNPLPPPPSPDAVAGAPESNGATREARAPRSNRVPFGAPELKMRADERPGFKRRWFNDVPGRIGRAQKAGYEHVRDEKSGQPVSQVVGVAKEGGGQTAYLMEIPVEFYQEDQAAKDAPLRQFDQDVRRGAVNGSPGQDGRYVPQNADGTSRIKIETR